MKLNSKLLIIHLITGCILVLITGYYTNVYLREEKFQSIQDGFINQIYQVDFAISNFLLGVAYDVEDLVANETVRTGDDQEFTSFLEADENTFEYNIGQTEQAIIDVFNNYRLTHPYANSVYMGRENGTFVRSHKRNRPTQYDPRERPWYQLAVSNPDEVKRTAPYRSVTTPDVNIGTVKALVDEQGQVYGVVGVDITLRNLTEYISTIDVGENSYIVLLENNGIILTGQDEEIRFKRYDEVGLDYFQAVMENATGYILIEEGGTKKYLFYYTSPALGWKISVITPVQEIDRAVSQFANRTMGILLLSLFLLSALTMVGVYRFIIRPIKALERSTEIIMQTGDLDHRIAVKTGDEIGQLAASFKKMVASIKQAGEELRASEEKHRTLVENINVGVFRSTPESPGRLLHANPAAVTILGYNSVAEAKKVPMGELYEDAEERRLLIQRLAKGASIKNHELRLRKKDGTPIWASLSITAQRDEAGYVKWLEGVIEDITARKRAEEALRRAHDELEQRVTERTAALSETNAILKQEIIERKQAEEALQVLYRRTQDELVLAHEIQQSLLPPTQPDWTQPDVVCYSAPAREVGGDFYRYHAFSSSGGEKREGDETRSRYAFAIGDVSGKGVSAALLMAASLSQFDAALPRKFTPSERLAYLDYAIYPYTQPRGQNCALCYVELDLDPKDFKNPSGLAQLHIINAGCIPPYVRRKNGHIEWPKIGGFALGQGLGAERGYQEVTLNLSPGDLVILTSDGVAEATNGTGEMFGFERLAEVIANGPTSSAAEMMAHLKAEVAKFMGRAEPRDDMTIVVVQLK